MRRYLNATLAAAALVAAYLVGGATGSVSAWWTIPNVSGVAFAPQSRVYAQDLQVLADAFRGWGVELSNANELAVTAQASPDMTVAVASGAALFGPGTRVIYAGGNATITTAHSTNPRIDLVSISNAGSIVVTAGTAAAEASVQPPAVPANNAVLAFVYVPAGDTAINSNQITDKRGAVIRHAPSRYDYTGETITLSPTATQNDYNPAGFSEASFVRLTPNVSNMPIWEVTGWVPTYTDRCVTFDNADSADAVFFHRESSSSTAANRMTWSGTFPLILFPGDEAQFCYDNTDSRWELIAASRPPGPPAWDVWNEGFTATGLSGTSTSGTAASCQAGSFGANATEKTLGEVQCDTGSTSTGRAAISATGIVNSTPGALGPAAFLARVAPEATSDGTQRFQVRVGFHDFGTEPADGVYWEYDDATSADWRTVAAGTSTRTKNTVTGFTVGTTFVWLGAYCNVTWSQCAFFYSSDSSAWTVFSTAITDGNIPTSTELFTPASGISKSVGTAQRNMDTDVLAWRYDYAR